MEFNIKGSIEKLFHYFGKEVDAKQEKNIIEAIKKKLPNLKPTGVMPFIEPNGEIRRSGDSVRYVDALIQRFFNEGEVDLPTGQRSSHEVRMFRERLQREHPREYAKLMVNRKDKVSLLIQANQVEGEDSKYVGQNILNLYDAKIKIKSTGISANMYGV